jgi:hypothetical protein
MALEEKDPVENEQIIEEEEIKPRRRRRRTGAIWNLLTSFIILGIFVMGIYFALIYSYPGSLLNPFPFPTLPQTLQVPSPAATESSPAVVIQATQVPSVTMVVPEEITVLPTGPIQPPPTLPQDLSTPIATATLKPGVNYPYVLQSKPEAISGAVYNRSCGWMGVAGRIVDLQGRHATGIFVHLGGKLQGQKMDITSLSGTALDYGQSGYEFTIADQPVASTQTLWVQLIDQSGLSLSDRFLFDTYADCEKNLILISFKQVR